MELAFASLHQLCAPLLDRLGQPSGSAAPCAGDRVRTERGGAPDRFLVGLAVLTLLSEVAEERPLLCVVDDAQWLDRASAQTLAFVARRLLAEPVGLVFAAREPGEELEGLPDFEVRGLRERRCARAVGPRSFRVRLDERVRDRHRGRDARATRWRCSSCREGMSAAQLAGGFGLLGAQPLYRGGSRRASVRRLEALAGRAGCCLLVAAAEPVGDPPLLWRAAERLGIGPSAAEAAEAAGCWRSASG